MHSKVLIFFVVSILAPLAYAAPGDTRQLKLSTGQMSVDFPRITTADGQSHLVDEDSNVETLCTKLGFEPTQSLAQSSRDGEITVELYRDGKMSKPAEDRYIQTLICNTKAAVNPALTYVTREELAEKRVRFAHPSIHWSEVQADAPLTIHSNPRGVCRYLGFRRFVQWTLGVRGEGDNPLGPVLNADAYIARIEPLERPIESIVCETPVPTADEAHEIRKHPYRVARAYLEAIDVADLRSARLFAVGERKHRAAIEGASIYKFEYDNFIGALEKKFGKPLKIADLLTISHHAYATKLFHETERAEFQKKLFQDLLSQPLDQAAADALPIGHEIAAKTDENFPTVEKFKADIFGLRFGKKQKLTEEEEIDAYMGNHFFAAGGYLLSKLAGRVGISPADSLREYLADEEVKETLDALNEISPLPAAEDAGVKTKPAPSPPLEELPN